MFLTGCVRGCFLLSLKCRVVLATERKDRRRGARAVGRRRLDEKMKLMLWLWVAGLSLRMVLGLITEENGVERKFVHYLLGFGPPSAEDRLTYSYKGEVSYLGGDPCLGVPKDADVKGKFVLFDIALGFRKCPVEVSGAIACEMEGAELGFFSSCL